MAISAIVNAQGYDWSSWLVGIIRSAVSGGATAILNTTGTALVLPNDVNTGAGLHKLLALLGIYFALGAIVHMAIFLETHGAPDKLQQALAEAAVQSQQAVVQAAKVQDAVADASKAAQ
jgi:hypothetical protein